MNHKISMVFSLYLLMEKCKAPFSIIMKRKGHRAADEKIVGKPFKLFLALNVEKINFFFVGEHLLPRSNGWEPLP